MNRRRGRHRLNRRTRRAPAIRPGDRPERRTGILAATRALLASAVGLLIMTGTATGLVNAGGDTIGNPSGTATANP